MRWSPIISSSTASGSERYREGRLSLDAPIKLGRQTVAAHGDVRLVDRGDDNRTLNALGRLSTNINGFNLTTLVDWQHRLGEGRDPSTTTGWSWA